MHLAPGRLEQLQQYLWLGTATAGALGEPGCLGMPRGGAKGEFHAVFARFYRQKKVGGMGYRRDPIGIMYDRMGSSDRQYPSSFWCMSTPPNKMHILLLEICFFLKSHGRFGAFLK